MTRIALTTAVVTCVLLSAAPLRAEPTFDINLLLNNRGTGSGGFRDITVLYDTQQMRYNTYTYLLAQPSELHYSGFAQASVDAFFTDWFAVHLMLNSGEIRQTTLSLDGTSQGIQTIWTANGRAVGDEALATGFAREALLDFHDADTQWWQLVAGRKLWRIANSLIYDDYGLGIGLSFDFDLLRGSPWRFEIDYIIPSRDWTQPPLTSPLLTAHLDYMFSVFDNLSLSLTYFHDGAGQLTEVMRQAVVEHVVNVDMSGRLPAVQRVLDKSQQTALSCYLNSQFTAMGDLAYATLGANKTLGPGRLRGTAVLQAGTMVVTGAPVVADNCQATQRTALFTFDTVATAFDVQYAWTIVPQFTLTPFVFGESGQSPLYPGPQSKQTYSAFLGVLPFITRTNLFFAGGLSETFGSRRLTSAGVNGRGVITGGLQATIEPVNVFRIKALATPLFSWAQPIGPPVGGGGRFYGVELDAIVYYQPWRFLGFALEADGLFGSQFYREQTPAWKVILSTNLAGAWSL